MDKKIAKLYYVKHNGENVGYVIIDIVDYKILEYSVLTPAYDMVNVDGDKVYLYVNGMPLIYANNTYYELSISGKIISSKNNTSLYYYPNIQSGNCIVGAISNLIWHYGKNGYDSLISGMNFSEVEKSVDTIINNEGGYVNNNIPNTIRRYVSSKTSKYSVSVTNKWNPTFYNVQVEVSTRPCLLGFAAGSPYSDSVGHMTVCVGTRLYNNWGYVQVMDGWSTGVVEKAWGSYNDFMSLVLFSN